MAVEPRCSLRGISVTGWGGRSARGTPSSVTATLADVVHGATREQFEGWQCGQSCSEPCTHEGVPDGSASCSEVAEERWAKAVWLSPWEPRIGEAQPVPVLVASIASNSKRATALPLGIHLRYPMRAP
jgi:hypothetical protein